MINIGIKPLSVNDCWMGRRFKTPAYKKYERDCLLMLPKMRLPGTPYKVTIYLNLSSLLSDIDNPIKPLLDILQKKYKFNDKEIFELNVRKMKCMKGADFFSFKIESLYE